MSGMPPLDTDFLNTMQFDIMNGLMDPYTFIPSSSESSSLDKDFLTLDDMHSTQGDFSWAFNVCFPVKASSDHDVQQTNAMGLSENLTSVDDNDEGDGYNATKVVIDTSHWDHTIDEDKEGTMWAQQNSDYPVIPSQTQRGNASNETCKLKVTQAPQ
ncbi:uncharacterized protein ARMOST_06618 [Armillaria ostoyae]|uniref:Uncharacterized protein n=1 Tax=Armillaria ostoyae TaxID=47428 RepID=A0A284R3I7_ARMOS|nr:uncharacterized protein ARMOST_06618 [Armillaria ostoyae]